MTKEKNMYNSKVERHRSTKAEKRGQQRSRKEKNQVKQRSKEA